ncbi:MAG: NAD(P)-dependent oxidoreductase [Dehalococcoidia bacterium]
MQPGVSVIGLGLMGTALADAFLKNGNPTTVWNRSPQKADALVAQGALRATTVADAASASPLVVVCVLDYDAVREILHPAADAIAGRAVANLTSGTPEQARDTAAWATDRGAAYLDGKILATPSMVGGPQALLFLSGSQGVFEAQQQALSRLGAITYFGTDPGLAAVFDIALLGLMYATVTGFLHSAALAGTEQVSAMTLLPYATEWLKGVTGFLPDLARQVDDGDYRDADATLAMQAVGMNHMIHANQARGIDTELPSYVKALMERAIAAGHGADGFASLIEVIKKPTA